MEVLAKKEKKYQYMKHIPFRMCPNTCNISLFGDISNARRRLAPHVPHPSTSMCTTLFLIHGQQFQLALCLSSSLVHVPLSYVALTSKQTQYKALHI